MSEFCESIIDDLRVQDKLGIKVASIIEDYTEENPYKLVWRFDFDETLVSVCNISGYRYDKNNLTEEDLDDIEQEHGYLKNITTFIEQWIVGDGKEVLDDGSSYIDYVNEGWPNSDGKTYSGRQYWLTEKGNRLDDCFFDDWELSEDGLFAFDNLELPDITRVFEDEVLGYDYRIDE